MMISDRVENLRMVTVSMEAGVTAEKMDLTSTPQEWEFVFGIGSEGLTPLEFELSGKNVGEEVLMHVKREDLAEILQHAPIPRFWLSRPLEGCWLKLRVVGVREADQREIIKALAELAACGSQCCGH
jgi:hypothetical protein